MAIYHLRWRGDRDGKQTGWYITAADGTEYGRIIWRTEGTIAVVHNDGSLFRACGRSHGASFQAASALVEDSERAVQAYDEAISRDVGV